MTLETSLQNIADALNNLAAAVQGKGQISIDLTRGQHSDATSGKPPKAETKPAKTEPKAEAPKPDAKPEKAADTQPTAAAPETAPAEKAASSAKPLDYAKDIQPRFLELVKVKGRDAAVGLIHQYNPAAAKLSEAIKPEQYASVLAQINALLGE
jgi:hypothetical protein